MISLLDRESTVTTGAHMATAHRLVASTVELRAEVDLARVAGPDGVLWERDGAGFAGRGTALTVRVPPGGLAAAAAEVADLLSSIEVRGPRLPVAVGALPFATSAAGEMVVPEILVRRDPDGSGWLTVVGADPEPGSAARRLVSVETLEPLGTVARGERPTEYRVTASTSVDEWCEWVADAADAVAAGRLAKVVLAREVTVTSDRAIAVVDVARRLRSAYPSCMVFAVGGFVGASPELLVAREGDRVWSEPLAGTAPRHDVPGSGPEQASSLLSSPKDREEHRLVVEAVAEGLAGYCHDLAVPATPSLVSVGNIAHLGTEVEGRLSDPRTSVLELVAALHPTPAVAGTPTGAALDYLAAVERIDRGRYAGPVGWVDAAGDGRWAVGIRSAEIADRRARLLAGAGIVAQSTPEAELAETELKLQPMLNAIVRP